MHFKWDFKSFSLTLILYFQLFIFFLGYWSSGLFYATIHQVLKFVSNRTPLSTLYNGLQWDAVGHSVSLALWKRETVYSAIGITYPNRTGLWNHKKASTPCITRQNF